MEAPRPQKNHRGAQVRGRPKLEAVLKEAGMAPPCSGVRARLLVYTHPSSSHPGNRVRALDSDLDANHAPLLCLGNVSSELWASAFPSVKWW